MIVQIKKYNTIDYEFFPGGGGTLILVIYAGVRPNGVPFSEVL